ncbi:DNA polymerase delta subunit 3 [Fusarium tjaetaba]|uniref:DNA polymerase delta subunit 3 n=1 Tax=Fusarium tjaetaba TaxID=1567544 RepID=A0A8H5QIM6_9HYPO|nr:DNA polymerase delta subunit 3 [Fusarium tjaetaba]KAF5615939.1 DNA polymerase delta subunit 3 [Fusarium tjaetaba]
MDEHKKYLADRLLSEEQPITYRVLSRALDVHVNTAKEMLYDFHSYQNAQKANSVHATYLIYGTKTPEKDGSDGDVEMSGSSPEEPLSDEVPTSTLTLAREEELNDILAAYEQVVSIHVYSLSPHPQKDLSLLSDVASQLSEYSSSGDITAASKKYGVISNPNAQRRERTVRPSAPSQAVKKEPVASKSASKTAVKQETSTVKPEAKQIKSAKQESSAPSSKEGSPAPSGGKKPAASLKRGVSGGIMQSFAKAAARPPKPKPGPKKEEDTAMALSDDGEADDSDIVATKSKSTIDSTDIKRKRQEREDALRKMMEDDDEEEEKEESDKESEQADEEMEEAPEPEPEPEAKKEESEPAEVISGTGDGRRRGRRRVMKKKRILDDQGYMVTIQEPGWESFSEDEAPPVTKKAAPAPTPTPSSSTGSKSKKPAPKGQGNIMSFFSKK